MPIPNLNFAKIVTNPTSQSWSQAHNAGSLFFCLSLTTDNQEEQKKLAELGNNLIHKLSAEFYALEEKNIAEIKKVISIIHEELPNTANLSLALAYSKDTVLYLFLVGKGKIILKRDNQLGTLLENKESTSSKEILSASGYLKNNDLIIIETGEFLDSISPKTLHKALEYTLPNEIAEALTPHLHATKEGGTAATIIITVQGIPSSFENTEDYVSNLEENEGNLPVSSLKEAPSIEETPQEITDEKLEDDLKSDITPKRYSITLKFLSSHILVLWQRLSHKNKLYGTVAIILLIVLLISIYIFKTNQENAHNKQLFNQIYTQAKQKYDEGESILSLNASLAREDFQKAKSIIKEGSLKLKKGTKEYEQLAQLEKLIDEKLTETENSFRIEPKEIKEEDVPLLSLLAKTKDALAATEDEKNYYVLTDKALSAISKDTGAKKTLITNNNFWDKAVGVHTFSGNFYILEKGKDILKFVPTTSDYVKTSYFKEDTPSLNNAVSFAIDRSIWILFADGSVNKYTRGKKDVFSITGLEQKLQKPSFILTAEGFSSIYLIDSASGLLIKIGKDGNYRASYQSDILKKTQFINISKDENTAFLLVSGKFYSLSLK
jgi:hypothetical protein